MKRPFERILIANRGEIAVRVMRACKELGIESIAICSEVDRHALHAQYADKIKCIGGNDLTDSYLNMEKIITAALEMKCEAIHPGYGFLAENDAFAALCEKNGIKFIGPSSKAIGKFGNKNEARKMLKNGGVPIVPGTKDKLRDFDEAKRVAEYIGYPVMIKASAGGGGRGIKIANNEKELADAFHAAQVEAKSAFGDDELFMEKYLRGIRHIEFQILADEYENIIHLMERDCSVQRRHQKLLEEAPSPAMTEELRKQAGETAIRAAEVAGYTNAGTVEFLFAGEDFYFLEMNTRIQVEHPITEAITGIDLVKEQIHIAAGEPLRYSQADIKIHGHAIECRINAEDPYANFIPCPGQVTYYYAPGGNGVRVDSAMRSGYTIPPFYDSLIAKLIVWGENRQEATIRMKRALDEYVIDGVTTTIPFHQELLNHDRFLSGEISTDFVENEFIFGGRPYKDQYKEVAIISAVLSKYLTENQVARYPLNEKYLPSSWKLMGRVTEVPNKNALQKRRLVGESQSIWSRMRNYRTYARFRS